MEVARQPIGRMFEAINCAVGGFRLPGPSAEAQMRDAEYLVVQRSKLWWVLEGALGA